MPSVGEDLYNQEASSIASERVDWCSLPREQSGTIQLNQTIQMSYGLKKFLTEIFEEQGISIFIVALLGGGSELVEMWVSSLGKQICSIQRTARNRMKLVETMDLMCIQQHGYITKAKEGENNMLHNVIFINQIYAYIHKPKIHMKHITMAFPGMEREKEVSCRNKRGKKKRLAKGSRKHRCHFQKKEE